MSILDYGSVRAEILALRLDQDLDAARRLVLEYRERFPDNPMWILEWGIQIFVEGDLVSSLAIFADIALIEGFAGQLESMLRCADILAQLGRFEDAEAAYDRAETAFPKYSEMLKLRCDLALKRRYHDAVTHIQKAGAGVQSAEKRDALLLVLNDFVKEMPDQPYIGLHRGRLLRMGGHAEEAIESLLPVIENLDFAGRLEAMMELARAYSQANDVDAVWDVCLRMRREFSGKAAFSIIAMELMPKHGRLGQAVESVREEFPHLPPTERAAAAQSWVLHGALRSIADNMLRRSFTLTGSLPRNNHIRTTTRRSCC